MLKPLEAELKRNSTFINKIFFNQRASKGTDGHVRHSFGEIESLETKEAERGGQWGDSSKHSCQLGFAEQL